MMSRFAIPVGKWAAIASLLLCSSRLYAERSAADILPQSTMAYVEVSQPRDLISLVLDGSLFKELEKADAYRQAMQTPQYAQFMQVVALIEKQTGTKWRPTLERTIGGGVFFAFEPLSQGIVLLIKPEDLKSSDSIRDTIFAMVRDESIKKGLPDPISVKTYRGLTAYHAGEVIIANVGPWLMVSNKPGLATSVADKFLDGGDALSGDPHFAEARKAKTGDGGKPSAWAFVRTGPLRLVPGLFKLFDAKAKSDNAGTEFAFGGLIPILQNTPYITASAWMGEKRMKLSVQAPSESSWVPTEQKFFFASPGDGASKPLITKDTVFSITTYRDLSAMWQAAPDLFTEDIATQLAQSDSTLSTLFGGKSFSTDILGSLKPQMQFVVARQDYKAASVREPALRLPGAALVFTVKPDQFTSLRKKFRVGFQSAIALGNVDAGQKGRPMLEIHTETRGGAEIQYATFDSADEDASKTVPASDGKMAAKPGVDDIYLNFSPALVMSKTHMILCSTRQIAEDLADLSTKPNLASTIADNTAIRVAAQPLADLLDENREQLVAKNMLEKGHDRAAAEKETNLLHTLVRSFQDASVRLVPTEKSIQLDVELVFAAKK